MTAQTKHWCPIYVPRTYLLSLPRIFFCFSLLPNHLFNPILHTATFRAVICARFIYCLSFQVFSYSHALLVKLTDMRSLVLGTGTSKEMQMLSLHTSMTECESTGHGT